MQWILSDIPLGRNIQKIRISKGITQSELVIQLQLRGSMISRSTLANIETGRRNIKASDLRLIKEVLEVDFDVLFFDDLCKPVS